MAWHEFEGDAVNVGVVGAGIAGLTVALGLEQAGHDVTLYEASGEIGGRMGSLTVNGHVVDHGFHVLHTAYPTVKRWIDVDALDAKPMDPCTASIDPTTGKRRLLGDALRSPKYLLPTLKSVGIADGLRFLRWRMSTSARDLERSLDSASTTISEALEARKFRPSTRRVLSTLFAGITLDPTLSERSGFADFTWGAMAHGSMVVPKAGIVAVPKQLAARLKATKVRLQTAVKAVTSTTVTTMNETVNHDRVVLATPQHVTAQLLPSTRPNHETVERTTSTVVFETSTPPFKRARLLINERFGEEGHEVLHVYVPTNLHPSPNGQHVVVATLVGESAQNPDTRKVLQELEGWFGTGVHRWEPLATTVVRHALPHQPLDFVGREVPEVDHNGVLLAGDHRSHPSVQGALRSAERVLKQMEIPLPR